MSLPPGFLDELRTRLSLGQVVGRKVMWDNRKSNPGKGDLWAPCPFHQEKTASFHVDDKKGFYYCFGCHAKGDAITFVRESENVSFMEAVEILAGEAGMTMPAPDPQAREKADHRTQLADVMEQAVRFFRLQLQTGKGQAARDYLKGRGLSDSALERWEIGFAPPGWSNLWAYLREKGVDPNLILGAGLARASDQGKEPYDTFRHRIMFPIRDARGRCIAFGGRAMDPNDNAKYLNSPETELFDKSRSLFNIKRAREAAGKGQPLIVAEGYMDVIALSEAGFEASVAPLGTAVTDAQLAMLWRVAPEPLMMLDGDVAGQRAAMRVIDLALPLLEAGKSVRFAQLPAGQDPDDLLRAKGVSAVQGCLEAALPMVQLLWQREIDGKSFDSPERRAALDKALRDKIALIRDPSVRQHYGAAIKQLRWDLFAPQRQPGRGRGRTWTPQQPVPKAATKSSSLAIGSAEADMLREAVILATIIRNPRMVQMFYAELEAMEVSFPLHRQVRDAILSAASEQLEDDITDQIGSDPLEKLFSQAHVSITPAVRRPDNGDLAELSLRAEFSRLQADRGHEREVEEAIEDMISESVDERLTRRLAQSSSAYHKVGHDDDDDSAEYEVSESGARIKREEKSAFEDLLKTIGFDKKR